MSAPARQVRARSASKPRARTSPSLRVVPPPKRRTPIFFYVVASAIVSAMVFGIAATHVLLAQGAFEVDTLTRQEHELLQRNGELRREFLEASAPNRIAKEARGLGLVLPTSIEIVRPRIDPQAPRVPGGPD